MEEIINFLKYKGNKPTDIEDSGRISPFLKCLMKLHLDNNYQCQLTPQIKIPRNCMPHKNVYNTSYGEFLKKTRT